MIINFSVRWIVCSMGFIISSNKSEVCIRDLNIITHLSAVPKEQNTIDSLTITFESNKSEKIQYIYYTFGNIEIGKCKLIDKCYKVFKDDKKLRVQAEKNSFEIKNNKIMVTFYLPSSALSRINYAMVYISDTEGNYSNEIHLTNSKKLEKIKCN
jgi:hypothetical protein